MKCQINIVEIKSKKEINLLELSVCFLFDKSIFFKILENSQTREQVTSSSLNDVSKQNGRLVTVTPSLLETGVKKLDEKADLCFFM